ncbi:class 3 adenylate cyclase/CheY-like chemotaxis protein [Microbacterium sp. BE35]|uniref:response regulator n=1 Tax=Microbacterium sp. BE35 TaxID=2817773 RepID=UPI002859EF4B|nr:response regulator [Microbacterium sp. BE35]MDR7189584.1 class 3 adenylate cyclase/CheY-like chemotaxis protein [Microbacterium sp. BE35]
MPRDPILVLAVDDLEQNLRLLDAVLSPRGYGVVTAASGEEALAQLERHDIDLVLLDIMMPGIDGYEVCRRIRAVPRWRFLPVVMITASGDQEKRHALEAGADDFVSKPFDQAELIARVASLARLKRYHDTIERQAAELARWNVELEARVASQVEELERVNRLRRFLSRQVVDVVLDAGDEAVLASHRRDIVVVFCDLRGFTAFAEASEPEEVMGVLSEYHVVLGELIDRYEGTLERFTGDGVMVFFNDPLPLDEPARRAIEMAIEIRDKVGDLTAEWHRRAIDLGIGIGVAQGYATLGRIGFEGRFDYAAIGSVTNLAARLCAAAAAGQILVAQRAFTAVEEHIAASPVGELDVRGFSRAVRAYAVDGIRHPENRVAP